MLVKYLKNTKSFDVTPSHDAQISRYDAFRDMKVLDFYYICTISYNQNLIRKLRFN